MGTGGSRYGAGRPGWRRKCEQSLPLDIRRLKAAGRLRPGQYFGWQWTRGGEWIGNVGATTSEHGLTLDYAWTPPDGDPQPVRCWIAFTTTSCHFGGVRTWFLCPRCGRRCGLVYFARGTFACRVCLRLGYVSESLDTLDRLWRKQGKLEARLGPEGQKPKRMRWRTYERLLDKIDNVELAKDAAWWPSFARLAARFGADPTDLMAELDADQSN